MLPNFAMTDYTSQGKTRTFNVVDLSSTRSHQSYYTALSRSASATGTVILQGFDTYKITGGASGVLRQEFRELEMLDDITMLCYNRKLPSSVVGIHRNDLISAFRLLKGEEYVPSKVHRAIRWKENDPLHLSEGTDVAWRIVDSSDKPNPAACSNKQLLPHVIQADRAQSPLLGKRKLGADFETEASGAASKRIRMSSESTMKCCIPKILNKAGSNTTTERRTSIVLGSPRGLQWSNNSCAFDAVLSILYNIWLDNVAERTAQFKDINDEYLGQIANNFSQTRPQGTVYTLEEVHNFMQRCLQRVDPAIFAWGRYTGIQYILDYLLSMSLPVMSSSVRCPNDHPLHRADLLASSCQITVLHQCPDIQTFIDDQSIECASRCHVCQSHTVRQHIFEDTPAIITFDLSQHHISLSEGIVIPTVNGDRTTYKLRGVMYHLNNHFTSHFILESGCVWYHDGISTGRQMMPEGSVGNMSDLSTCQTQMAICAVYVIPCVQENSDLPC